MILSYVCSHNPIFADPPIGLFFSSTAFTEHGFLILGVEISKTSKGNRFLGQELRFHQKLGWEEALFSGEAIWADEKGWELAPNSCQVRANTDFSKKRGIVRRFDCEHLRFQIQKNVRGTTISSSLFGTFSDLSFPHFLPETAGEPIAISIPVLTDHGEEDGIWGFHLNGIGKSNPVQVWNPTTLKWDAFRGFDRPKVKGEYGIYKWRRTFSD